MRDERTDTADAHQCDETANTQQRKSVRKNSLEVATDGGLFVQLHCAHEHHDIAEVVRQRAGRRSVRAAGIGAVVRMVPELAPPCLRERPRRQQLPTTTPQSVRIEPPSQETGGSLVYLLAGEGDEDGRHRGHRRGRAATLHACAAEYLQQNNERHVKTGRKLTEIREKCGGNVRETRKEVPR